jgi:hypothetical protein
MNTEHTPGPWIKNGRDIAKEDGGIIVTAWYYGNKGTVTKEEANANAELIAAAPEMIDALITILKEWEYGTYSPEFFLETVNPKSIIEKATGKPWAELQGPEILPVEKVRGILGGSGKEAGE